MNQDIIITFGLFILSFISGMLGLGVAFAAIPHLGTVHWDVSLMIPLKETVIMKKIAPLVISIILMFYGCSNAGGLDDVLNNAKKEGKVVMLELGSVGCIPCDQMKPVMQKLRDTYKGKLEVIFIDLRRDNASGRRFGVYMIPTQVFLDKNGKEFHRHIGFYGYEEIKPVLKKIGL